MWNEPLTNPDFFPQFQSSKSTFFNDWENCASGIIKGADDHLARNSFAMKMVAFVEGNSCTGYLVEVMREVDGKVGYVYKIINLCYIFSESQSVA